MAHRGDEARRPKDLSLPRLGREMAREGGFGPRGGLGQSAFE